MSSKRLTVYNMVTTENLWSNTQVVNQNIYIYKNNNNNNKIENLN